MKKLLLGTLLLLGTSAATLAQSVKFGIKAGANFSNVDAQDVNTDNITSWHAGALVEIHALPNFSVQPELFYSSQGAKVQGADDFKFDYIAVPVLAKFYLIADKLSLEAGPQFSFLVNDESPFSGIADDFDSQSFDFGVIGGLGFNITEHIFAQARYVVGLSDTTKNADVTNKVIQLSAGIRF